MESWFMLACSMNFGARVDQFIEDHSGKFDNFHPFSVAQSTGGLAKGFDYQDWVAYRILHSMMSYCILGNGAAASLDQIPVKCLA
jgi:hypothetical protein